MAEDGADISLEGKLILHYLDEFKKDQMAQWQAQDAAVVRIHDRIDQMARDFTELVKANAKNITRADCDACKEKKHGVNPWFACAGIPLITWSLTTILQHAKDIGHWVVLVFKGG